MIDPAAMTASELLIVLEAGELTAVKLAQYCLHRVQTVDARIASVLAVLPDAEEQAAASDAYRRNHPARPLEGLPVLVKDNIAVTGSATTAGSSALARSCPPDAPLVTRLRDAGAVILAKTNLSEWANFRSTGSSSGWSALGGQTRNPHDLTRSPSGSSSGSAAAVAIGLAPLAVGTETDGSIISPAALCGVVGVKPTVGTVPGGGIVPISSAQDTAGPMARSVADATLLLSVLAGTKASGPPPTDLRGLRLGLWRPSDLDINTADVLESVVRTLADAGATIVPTELDAAALKADEWPALLTEFHDEIDRYLASAPDAAVRSLDELVRFNLEHQDELSKFGQEIFEQSLAAPPVTDPTYRAHRARATDTARSIIDDALAAADLTAVLTVSNSPAWPIDYITGDRVGVSTTGPAAIAGYPSVTVPAGDVAGMPVGVSLLGTGGNDLQLLGVAAAIESALAAPVRPDLRP